MKSVSAATPPVLFPGSSSTMDGPSSSLSSSSYATTALYYLFIAAAAVGLALRLYATATKKRRSRRDSLRATVPSSAGKRLDVAEGDCDDDDGAATSQDKSDMMRALRHDRLPDGSTIPVDHPSVSEPLDRLKSAYASWDVDARTSTTHPMDGDFLMEHSPSFIGKLGHSKDSGDPLFTMGRMTFSMIRPTEAVCSLQRVTQHVHRLGPTEALPEKMPPKLRDHIEKNAGELRTFVTKMYFTVEDDASLENNDDHGDDHAESEDDEEEKKEDEPSTRRRQARGPRGVMRMDGYCYPDPAVPNRLAVWFSGGVCSPQRDCDPAQWRNTFGRFEEMPPRPISERLMLFAAKAFMGAVPLEGFDPVDNLSLRFELRRPIAAHQDMAYNDDDLRVTVGSKGTVVICSRLRRDA